jgi:predicted glycosyltransferase involved in capsule biosynthesis
MGWHDRRNDNKYREYKVKNKEIIIENHLLMGIDKSIIQLDILAVI